MLTSLTLTFSLTLIPGLHLMYLKVFICKNECIMMCDPFKVLDSTSFSCSFSVYGSVLSLLNLSVSFRDHQHFFCILYYEWIACLLSPTLMCFISSSTPVTLLAKRLTAYIQPTSRPLLLPNKCLFAVCSEKQSNSAIEKLSFIAQRTT